MDNQDYSGDISHVRTLHSKFSEGNTISSKEEIAKTPSSDFLKILGIVLIGGLVYYLHKKG